MPASSAAPGGVRAPARRRPLRGAVRGGGDHRVDARPDRRAQLGVGRRRAGHQRAQAVAQPADAAFERAHEVAGADHLVPARQHLAAQQRAAAHGLVDLVERARRRRAPRPRAAPAPRPPARRARPARSPPAAGSSRARPPASGARARRAPRRPPPARRASRAPARAPPPAAGRPPARSPRPPAARCRRARARRASRAGGPAPRRAASARDAVEDERDGGAAVARRLQHVPRHRVGVARGGRHEQPRVGRGQQLPGERPVGLHDGVDVGRVEEGEPRRERVGRRQLEPAGRRVAAGRAGEAREDAVVLEPAHVAGVAHQHRRSRRRPQHAGRADLRAHQRVHERRLAGARRAAHDHQQRRVHLAQPRQQVVADLAGQLVAHAPRLRRGGRVERERHGAQLVAQRDQGSGDHAREPSRCGVPPSARAPSPARSRFRHPCARAAGSPPRRAAARTARAHGRVRAARAAGRGRVGADVRGRRPGRRAAVGARRRARGRDGRRGRLAVAAHAGARRDAGRGARADPRRARLRARPEAADALGRAGLGRRARARGAERRHAPLPRRRPVAGHHAAPRRRAARHRRRAALLVAARRLARLPVPRARLAADPRGHPDHRDRDRRARSGSAARSPR